jgi:hypothetical protein
MMAEVAGLLLAPVAAAESEVLVVLVEPAAVHVLSRSSRLEPERTDAYGCTVE